MKLDRSELWLLRSVIYWTSPIDVLGASEQDIWEWFGYPGLDLSQGELIQVLHHLFQSGDLVAFARDQNSQDKMTSFVPTQKDIKDGLSQNMSFNYGLTAQGGYRWETAVIADWTRFYQIALLPPLAKKIAVTGSDRSFMEQAIAAWAKVQNFRVVNPAWRTFEPYHVTYWKTLATGYEVTYEYDYSKSKTTAFDRRPYPDIPDWHAKIE